MPEIESLAPYLGASMVGPDGSRIGRIDEIYLDDQTGKPTWALVHTGLLGSTASFVPLAHAVPRQDRLEVPYDKAKVKDAPRIDADGHLSVEQERELYRYYGLGEGQGGEAASTATPTGEASSNAETTRAVDVSSAGASPATGVAQDARAASSVDTAPADRASSEDAPPPASETRPADQGVSAGPSAADHHAPTGADEGAHDLAEEPLTLSEEQLAAKTRVLPVARARLRKYQITEEVTVKVPITREVVRVEYEAVSLSESGEDAGPAVDQGDQGDEGHEVVLYQEVPVVQRRWVPVERIRIHVQPVTEEQQVTGTVQREELQVHPEGRTLRPSEGSPG